MWTGQHTVPIGDGLIETQDACIGIEVCEELWTAECSHVHQALDGVDIFTNGSGSQFGLQRLQNRY